MRIDDFKNFNATDFPMFAEKEDGERFLDQLNALMKGIVEALQGRLDFAHNFNCEIKEFDVQDDTAIEVSLDRLRGKVQHVLLLDPDIFDYHGLAWEHVSEGTIRIKISFTSTPTEAVSVKLLFLGG